EEGSAPGKIRRPGRREFVVLDPQRVLPTKLLLHKPKGPDSLDTDYYFVAKPLRARIGDELKPVRVSLFWSVQTRTHALWIVNVTPDNKWYDSLQDKLFRQPAEFFRQYEVRVFSDRDRGCYRVKH